MLHTVPGGWHLFGALGPAPGYWPSQSASTEPLAALAGMQNNRPTYPPEWLRPMTASELHAMSIRNTFGFDAWLAYRKHTEWGLDWWRDWADTAREMV